jgi:hypothetical protein
MQTKRMPSIVAASIRASSNGLKSSSLNSRAEPAPLSRTGPSPKFVTTSLTASPSRLAIATPFQRPSPWWVSV